ncbi:unnamed protein product [Trifolium pratense]|uniref:Uncharacterized protein n=1 Tax=Trifolium pratense TaxID=57577 RepID=A0ACB0IDE3_TRIPR|nr:unnamed protein product [Trifolium pratense]
MALGVAAVPFTYVAHVLGVVAIVLVFVWNLHFRGGLAWNSDNKALIFNLHPVLMLTGLIVFGGEVLGIIGIAAAFKNHNESGIANLYSLHSWLGIGVISLYGIQWIFGFVVFFYPGGSSELRRESVPWHVLFGLFVYILALATSSLGFLEKLTFLESSGVAKYGSEAFLVNFNAIITILFGTFVVLSAISQAPPAADDYAPI